MSRPQKYTMQELNLATEILFRQQAGDPIAGMVKSLGISRAKAWRLIDRYGNDPRVLRSVAMRKESNAKW